jgi:hypothetical protein
MSGLVISSIGLFLFMWGKKVGNMMHLGIGILLMALPMFVGSQAILWAVTGGLMIPAWTLRHS